MINAIHSDRLFLGNALDIRDLRQLHEYRIAAVVDLALNEPAAQLSRELIYCRIPLVDGDGNSTEIIEAAIRCLVSLLRLEFRTLVACSAGMSRSPAIAAAALAVVTGRAADECLMSVTTDRPHDVSPLLWSQVREIQQRMIP
ncbi:dual specificity protein phosphatase family protein [Anatilimnocola floriformis]|uniref:dual specificity protein phosphatase family protein n=1 Tax=Anatilimnocola floriformis TaxID=2948575 RepID=UPI0020C4CA41|nr:dual specificity protein phosphatase family protein [Anatilimnocola floriformis]